MFTISDDHCKSIMQIWRRHHRPYWGDILHGNRIIMHHSYSQSQYVTQCRSQRRKWKQCSIAYIKSSLYLLCILFLGTKLTGYTHTLAFQFGLFGSTFYDWIKNSYGTGGPTPGNLSLFENYACRLFRVIKRELYCIRP